MRFKRIATRATGGLLVTTAAVMAVGVTPALASHPEPAFDPCPVGYYGVIVGYDDSNSTGRRVYACVKTQP